jgi:ABC-2 type transport system permease protein
VAIIFIHFIPTFAASMAKQYNQSKALLAITKASLLAILKNPGALFFSLGFPLIFVWIFGSFGEGGVSQFKIALAQNADTSNAPLYQSIIHNPLIKLVRYKDTLEQRNDLEKGRISAIMNIVAVKDSTISLKYDIQLKSTTASIPDLATVVPVLENIVDKYEKGMNPQQQSLVSISKQIYSIREYKQIDFVLPGQIGFSILFSTLFGIAFTFYNLREQLVLKRFYASPVNKLNILLGIGFSRLLFQLINVIVLIAVGHFALGFTLSNGFATFAQMLLLAFLLLLVLMGVGLIFSSIVKSDSTIPLLINLFALPQMLLGGTFFSISVFPQWMQTFCKTLPLTHFNIAIRKISFEGLSFIDCWQNLGVIGIWLVVVYALVYKFFKWE